MSSTLLDIVKNNLSELNLGFALNHIDTFLHEEARKDRPFLETISDALFSLVPL